MREALVMVGDNCINFNDKDGEIVVHGFKAYMHDKLQLLNLL